MNWLALTASMQAEHLRIFASMIGPSCSLKM